MRRDSLCHLLLLTACGCFSSSLLQEPTPLPAGSARVAVGAEVGSHVFSPTVGVRIGVGHGVELRGKGAARGGEGGVNVRVHDGEFVDVMMMPLAFRYDVDDAFQEGFGAKIAGAGLPTVVGITPRPGTPSTQLFVAPDVRAGVRNGRGFAAVGLHVGAAASGPRDLGSFIPECAWFVGALGAKAGADTYEDERTLARGEHVFSCSLGVSFGGRHAVGDPR